MKKTLAVLVALAVSVAAFAQVKNQNVLFKHLSLGVGVGDDLHAEVATTLTPWLQMRVMYSTLMPYLGLAQSIAGSALPQGSTISPLHVPVTVNYKSEQITIDRVDVDGSINWHDINLLFDLYPAQASVFHFTVGAMIGLNPNLVSALAKPVPALNQADWTTTRFMGVTTNKEGNVNIDARFAMNVVKPYVGIGFGRPVTKNNAVGVNFDLGVAYIGGIHIFSKDYYENPDAPKDVEINSAWVNSDPDMKQQAGNYTQYLDMANSFPVLPVLRLTLNVRLF